MNETIINFEQFGKHLVRFSLPLEHTEQDRTGFLNLFWSQKGEREDENEGIESFCLTVKEWVSAINTFRIMNTGKIWHEKEIRERYLCLPNRERNVFVASGFRFVYQEQRPEVSIIPSWHNIGNANHETIKDEWSDLRSQFEPVEDGD